MRSLFKNVGEAARGRDEDRRPVIVAFDSSYCVFHRHHAMRRFERLSGMRGPDLDAGPAPPDDLVAFGDSLRQMLMTQAAAYGADESVVMMDCPRADIWRRDLHPEYKGSRAKPGDLPGNLFPHFHGVVVPALRAEVGMRVVGCPRAEADDVAEVLCRWAAPLGYDVVVVTGDADLAQLVRPGVRVVDLKGVDVLEKACKKAGCAVDAGTYLALKLLVGDKGDNIAAVRPRMGPKTALKVVRDLDAALADPPTRARHELNRTLMDLAAMPADVRAGIEQSLAAAFPGHGIKGVVVGSDHGRDGQGRGTGAEDGDPA